jgi:hypothetical protein
MIVDEALANIERTVNHLKATEPKFDEEPAVVVSPTWFLEMVRELYKQPADVEVDVIHGIKVMKRDELIEPFTISAGGRLFPVLPGWARAANAGRAN